jgi:hypothetical protein
LKLVKIGQRAVAAISDEVDQLIERRCGPSGMRRENRCAHSIQSDNPND